ncbi:unnamed protein product [Closterium sp. NIES-54]
MASPSVLTFDDLHLFLQCDRADGLSLFDLTSGVSPTPPATADSTVRSQWATRDAAARLAVRRHLPTTERAHFSQYRSAQTLYDAVVARYSSPATAALSRLFLPYLFPDLAAFPTVADLITHLRTSDARYRTALPAEAGAVEAVVEAVEGVGVVVGVAVEVEVSTAALEAVAAVAEAVVAEEEEVAEAAEAVVERVAALHRGVAPVVVSASSSSAVLRPPPLSSFVSGTLGCGGLHSTQRCFGCLTDAWRHQFPDATKIPRWGDLSRAGVAVFDLDYDAILAAMYALSTSDEGDCYLCVPPDPGIQAPALGAGETAALGARAYAAPGAGESAPSGTASAQVLHTFTLDSEASRSFFRDRTTLLPLSWPVAVSLADPSGGPVLASFSTVLPCPAAPSGSLSGLYLPSFSTNLVSGAALQDQGVDQFTPASQRVTHCTCARTGRHLATFTRRPGSSLYTLSTESPPVSASGQVAASSQVLAAASGSGPESAPCSCRLLSHQTLLWHHRLGHPSLPRLRGMASRVLDVTFDESVPYYRLFPCRTASLPPPPLFLAPGPPPVDPLPPQGPAPSGVSQVDAVEPVEPGGAVSGGAEPGGVATGGPEPGGAEPGVTEPGGAEPGGAGSARVASRGVSSRREVLSPQELREWFARRLRRATGAGGTPAPTGSGGACPGGAGAAGPGGTYEATGGSAGASGSTGATGSAGPGAIGATGVGVAGGVGAGGSAGAGPSEGTGAGAAGAGGATGAGALAWSPGAVPAGSGGAPRPRPYFVPLLEQVLGLPPSPGPAPPFECPQSVQSQSLLQPVSPLPAPSSYTGPTGGLAERRAPASRPASPARPACTSRRTSRPRPPALARQFSPRLVQRTKPRFWGATFPRADRLADFCK